MISAISLAGVVASIIFEGATDGEAFATYVEQVFAPKWKADDVVVMDNLSSHKSDRVRQAIEAQGARRRLQGVLQIPEIPVATSPL